MFVLYPRYKEIKSDFRNQYKMNVVELQGFIFVPLLSQCIQFRNFIELRAKKARACKLKNQLKKLCVTIQFHLTPIFKFSNKYNFGYRFLVNYFKNWTIRKDVFVIIKHH